MNFEKNKEQLSVPAASSNKIKETFPTPTLSEEQILLGNNSSWTVLDSVESDIDEPTLPPDASKQARKNFRKKRARARKRKAAELAMAIEMMEPLGNQNQSIQKTGEQVKKVIISPKKTSKEQNKNSSTASKNLTKSNPVKRKPINIGMRKSNKKPPSSRKQNCKRPKNNSGSTASLPHRSKRKEPPASSRELPTVNTDRYENYNADSYLWDQGRNWATNPHQFDSHRWHESMSDYYRGHGLKYNSEYPYYINDESSKTGHLDKRFKDEWVSQPSRNNEGNAVEYPGPSRDFQLVEMEVNKNILSRELPKIRKEKQRKSRWGDESVHSTYRSSSTRDHIIISNQVRVKMVNSSNQPTSNEESSGAFSHNTDLRNMESSLFHNPSNSSEAYRSHDEVKPHSSKDVQVKGWRRSFKETVSSRDVEVIDLDGESNSYQTRSSSIDMQNEPDIRAYNTVARIPRSSSSIPIVNYRSDQLSSGMFNTDNISSHIEYSNEILSQQQDMRGYNELVPLPSFSQQNYPNPSNSISHVEWSHQSSSKEIENVKKLPQDPPNDFQVIIMGDPEGAPIYAQDAIVIRSHLFIELDNRANSFEASERPLLFANTGIIPETNWYSIWCNDSYTRDWLLNWKLPGTYYIINASEAPWPASISIIIDNEVDTARVKKMLAYQNSHLQIEDWKYLGRTSASKAHYRFDFKVPCQVIARLEKQNWSIHWKLGNLLVQKNVTEMLDH